MSLVDHPFLVVVGSGGVGKTTLATAVALALADAGHDTLVMTFDPSHRLKDALGVSEQARFEEVPVDTGTPGRLAASLLDARTTFDRLVERYSPDANARRRILENRFYSHLAGHLAGILEYMAVERLYEVATEKRYDRVVLDTPPTRQALDFLEAPQRIVGFLESGALKVALRPWFDGEGRLRSVTPFGLFRRKFEAYLDRVVGLGLLRDMAEFFLAFEPLYEGFRARALEVQRLLRSEQTTFALVSTADHKHAPDTLFFARKLDEGGHRLDSVIVNRVHPRFDAATIGSHADDSASAEAARVLHWLGERDHRGVEHLRSLLPRHVPTEVPLLQRAPTDLPALRALGRTLLQPDPVAGGA